MKVERPSPIIYVWYSCILFEQHSSLASLNSYVDANEQLRTVFLVEFGFLFLNEHLWAVQEQDDSMNVVIEKICMGKLTVCDEKLFGYRSDTQGSEDSEIFKWCIKIS